jgi:hypothetical protein
VVPKSHVEDGFELGQWVAKRRLAYQHCRAAGGVVVASTDPSQPVGSGVAARAYDKANSSLPNPDGLEILAQAPGEPPGSDSGLPSSPPTPITGGKINIRLGR